MKRLLIIFFAGLFASVAAAEVTRKVTATHYYEGNPKKEMTFYNNGKEVAKEYYHVDGRVMGVKGSIPNGDVSEYYSGGQIKSQANYQSNLLYTEKDYFENGKLMSETANNWSGRNLIDSVNILYYSNGSKRQEIRMDGSGNGTSRLYYDSGELYEKAELRDAARNGAVTQYHKNGKIALTGSMKDDLLEGPAKEYNEKGQVVRQVIYKEGEVAGNAKK